MKYVMLATLLMALSIPAFGECDVPAAPPNTDNTHFVFFKGPAGSAGTSDDVDVYYDSANDGGNDYVAHLGDSAVLSAEPCSYIQVN